MVSILLLFFLGQNKKSNKSNKLIIRNLQDNNNNIKEFTNYIYVERVIKVLSKVLHSCSSVCHTVYVQSNTAYRYRQQEKRKRKKISFEETDDSSSNSILHLYNKSPFCSLLNIVLSF